MGNVGKLTLSTSPLTVAPLTTIPLPRLSATTLPPTNYIQNGGGEVWVASAAATHGREMGKRGCQKK